MRGRSKNSCVPRFIPIGGKWRGYCTRDGHHPKHSSCKLLVLHCADSFASFGFALVWYLSVLMILLPVVSKVIYTWRQAFLRCMVVRFDFTVSYRSTYSSTIYYVALESLLERSFHLKKKVIRNLASVFQVMTLPLVVSYDCGESIDSIRAFASKIESSIKCLQ